MRWEIKNKDNEVIFIVDKVEYNGKWMQECYVTTTIESPTPIDFQIGDYLIYRGERFEINYDPGKIKSAPRFAKGDAFRYDSVKFNSLQDELTRCVFLDIVPNDNQFHFTGLPKFSFYGSVKDLAGRLQANLDRAYGKNKWLVEVSSEFVDTKELNVLIDTKTCQEALEICVNDFEAYYTVTGRHIIIGAAGVPADHLFKYGKGNGLYEIEQNAEADQKIVTRLRAYGSTRNLPHRYYNSLIDADGVKLIPDNMAVQNLMLPEFPYTTQDPYIDSQNIDALGVREGTVFFDGSGELEEIYPSIEGMTAEQLKAAGVPCYATGALDVLVSAEQVMDNGVGNIKGDESTLDVNDSYFKVVIKDIGFDINEYLLTETAMLSFKTGKLGGREFEIVSCERIQLTQGTEVGYRLELKRTYDEDLKLWFPYKDYNAKGFMQTMDNPDKFVILQIKMPEVYIKAASEKLKDAAEEWLSKNDYSRSIYAPKIDEIFMARQHDLAMASNGLIKSLHDTIKEGMQLLFEDEDLGIDAAIFIDSLTIKEGEGLIPTYDVVLKEEKTVGTLQKIQNQIDSLVSGKGQGSGGYTAAQIRSMITAYGGNLFLSKLKDDQADGFIKFLKGASFGNFIQGLLGAQIDENGNAEVESLTSRSYLKVFELIYNRIATQEGDTSFSDSGTIDYIYETTNAGITAQLRKRWDGDFTSFQPGDVVYGYVNNLDKASAKEYGKAWARIVSVDRGTNVITLAPYTNAEVPGGVNLSLTESMIITRYGNAIEPSETTAANPNYAPFIKKKNGKWVNTRQSTFFISTDSGNLVELMGVNKPIVTKENMGLVLGKIPEGLLPANIEESLNPEQPYLYARGILVQDLIRIGYEGLQPRTSNYRGQWSAETAASTTEYYRNTTDMFDTVSHNGAMWQNVTVGTTDEPADTSSGWLRMTGTDDQTRGLWQIIPNASQIWIGEDETIYPDVLSVTVLRSSLKGDFEYTDNASLIAAGAKLQYSIDNSSEWHDFSMGTSEHLEVESGLGLTGEAAWFETESGEPFMTEGNNFTNLSDVTQNIRFRLVDIWANPNGGGEFTRVTVPVIRDGSSVAIASTSVKYAGTTTAAKPNDSAFTYTSLGTAFNNAKQQNGWIYTWSRTEVVYTDGNSTVTYTSTKDGAKGEKGAMVYPAGVFDSNTQYNSADGACPVVEYNNIYYLLKPGYVYISTALDDSAYPNPAVAAAANYKWEQFTMFKSVFTEVLMANFANIGSMIFYGDTIFSQDGRLGFIDTNTYDYNTQSYAKRYIDVTGLDGNGKAWYLRLNNEMTETGTLQQIIDNGNYLTNSTLGKFIPNTCINFKTGEVQTNKGLEIGQTNNPDEAAVAIVGHGNIISDGVIGGGVRVYEVATTDWNSPAASTLSLINRTEGSTFGVNLPTLRASLAAMGRKKKSGSGDTAVYDATEPFAYVITYVNTYTSVGKFLITGSGNPGNTMVGETISTQSKLPALVGSTRDSTANKPTSTTKTLLPGQTVQILLEYTGTPQSQSYKGTYTAYIL